ncbi:hypothetical protein GQ43DRAFT_441406 [Delitschia confertaspora ATCC 74209]|uniref:Uncharacterized protein n=1 Tax=Delitschia confertaspora ATCC 74209 TaxID=1513339 RepID=A0A9P4JQ88_9PLEO|nr:hypothetical protein GQ43DRAFT_441406 [Delitschia confertaspora ATCC 74209]
MPLCTLHLLSLHPQTHLQTFLSTLNSISPPPLLTSRVIRWIILPSKLSTSELLAQNIHWDLVVLVPGTSALSKEVQEKVQAKWSVVIGVPSKLVDGFRERNKNLLFPGPETIPELESGKKRKGVEREGGEESTSSSTSVGLNLIKGESAQNLQLDTALDKWITSFHSTGSPRDIATGPVTMLNLLSFLPNKKSSYLQYGAAFGSKVGKKFGGNAKIVGTVVETEGKQREEGDGGWDEVAFAQYPSLLHFRAMLRDEEYQEANSKFRLPSLRDTFILCTSEVGSEGWGVERARL